MNLVVKRIKQGKNSTLSEIYIDEELFGYGLEDRVRGARVEQSKSIPAGTYTIALYTYGAMHSRYKRRFGYKHSGILRIRGIADNPYAYIHRGKHFGLTNGGLLVGLDSKKDGEGDSFLLKHKVAYEVLYERVLKAMNKGEVTITFLDIVKVKKKKHQEATSKVSLAI